MTSIPYCQVVKKALAGRTHAMILESTVEPGFTLCGLQIGSGGLFRQQVSPKDLIHMTNCANCTATDVFVDLRTRVYKGESFEPETRECDECGRVEPASAFPDWPNGVCPECEDVWVGQEKADWEIALEKDLALTEDIVTRVPASKEPSKESAEGLLDPYLGECVAWFPYIGYYAWETIHRAQADQEIVLIPEMGGISIWTITYDE